MSFDDHEEVLPFEKTWFVTWCTVSFAKDACVCHLCNFCMVTPAQQIRTASEASAEPAQQAIAMNRFHHSCEEEKKGGSGRSFPCFTSAVVKEVTTKLKFIVKMLPEVAVCFSPANHQDTVTATTSHALVWQKHHAVELADMHNRDSGPT